MSGAAILFLLMLGLGVRLIRKVTWDYSFDRAVVQGGLGGILITVGLIGLAAVGVVVLIEALL